MRINFSFSTVFMLYLHNHAANIFAIEKSTKMALRLFMFLIVAFFSLPLRLKWVSFNHTEQLPSPAARRKPVDKAALLRPNLKTGSQSILTKSFYFSRILHSRLRWLFKMIAGYHILIRSCFTINFRHLLSQMMGDCAGIVNMFS